jgi:hypothetical protein
MDETGTSEPGPNVPTDATADAEAATAGSNFGNQQLLPEATQDTPGLAASSSSTVVNQLSAVAMERKREEERSKASSRVAKFWRVSRMLRAIRALAQLSCAKKVQALVRGFISRRRIRPFVAERLRLFLMMRYSHQRIVRLTGLPPHHRPNLAARRIQCAWRCRMARRVAAARRHLARAYAIMRAFRSYKFRKFVAGSEERVQLRIRRTAAVTKIQALARGVVVRTWFRNARADLEAAASERRPQQLREQRLAAVEHERLQAQRELEENNIRRIDKEILRVIMSLPASPNRAVLESSSQRLAVAPSTNASVDHRGTKLKLVPLQSTEGTFVDEPQLLLPGALARVTERPLLPRAVGPAALRKKAAEDVAAAKIVALLRREHAEESATMQYALRRNVDAPQSPSRTVQ